MCEQKTLGQIAFEVEKHAGKWNDQHPLSKKVWEDIAQSVAAHTISNDPIRKQLAEALGELFQTFQGLVEKSGHVPEDFPISMRTSRAALTAYKESRK